MSAHPYRNQPSYAFWSRGVAGISSDDVDPVVKGEFQISKADRVATAGSCFAQHIARNLVANGFNYFVTEKAHPIVPPHLVTSFNYGVFSARYGNIYTSRQLLQLIQRVYGEFQPKDDFWLDNENNLIDPFRPQIQPGGFPTESEYRADRIQHFAKVKQMFSELDVFVFTLGLTECWLSKEDGAAYPLCPGVSGGSFDSDKYHFVNLGVDEVTRDMLDFIDRLRQINPKAKVILTVSPVPLIATAEDRHVLVSNTYSKSVLRVAAEAVAKSRLNVAYFPSYEIITGNFSRGRYYDDDLRSVTETGVSHVMRLFLKHYAGMSVDTSKKLGDNQIVTQDAYAAEMAKLVKLNCDEESLDKNVPQIDKKVPQPHVDYVTKKPSSHNQENLNISLLMKLKKVDIMEIKKIVQSLLPFLKLKNAPKINLDQIFPKYEATMAEGVDFTRDGYPSFLAEISGMSVHEPWGRWSDASETPVVKFRFMRPLPKVFTLELLLSAYGPNVGQPVEVVVGKCSKNFVIETPRLAKCVLAFENIKGADTIEIIPPKPACPNEVDPNGYADSRLLGLGFVSLKIRD